MIRRVKIKLHSVINDLEDGIAAGDAEVNDIVCDGTLRECPEETVISYSECTEGGNVLTRVRILEGSITVTRQGAISSVMVFSLGERYDTVYEIAPYKFDMSITTLRMSSDVNSTGCSIDIRYKMTVGGADKLCRMKLEAGEVDA